MDIFVKLPVELQWKVFGHWWDQVWQPLNCATLRKKEQNPVLAELQHATLTLRGIIDDNNKGWDLQDNCKIVRDIFPTHWTVLWFPGWWLPKSYRKIQPPDDEHSVHIISTYNAENALYIGYWGADNGGVDHDYSSTRLISSYNADDTTTLSQT